VAPSQPNKPTRLGGTSTSIDIGWSAPSDDGGCPISSYRLFRDDGNSGSINTEVDSTNIENKPYLNRYTVSLPSNDTGLIFRF
jgi:hypothetical protein